MWIPALQESREVLGCVYIVDALVHTERRLPREEGREGGEWTVDIHYILIHTWYL